MTRNLFLSRKSLIFQIQRLIYDKWRYSENFFVHRKTFMDTVITQNDCYFHVTWRCFFIQDVNSPNTTRKYYPENFKSQESFINLIVDDKIYYTKMKELYGKTYDPIELIMDNKQSLSEIFYFTPLNLDSGKIEKQLQKMFINNISEIDQLYSFMTNKYNIGNYNLVDIGVISSFVESKDDKLMTTILDNYPNIPITDPEYKILIWNILNSSVIQIEDLEYINLFMENFSPK